MTATAGACLPSRLAPELLADLASDKTVKQLKEAWGLSPSWAAQLRRRHYPGHHRNGRRGRPKGSRLQKDRLKQKLSRTWVPKGLTPRQQEEGQ